MHNRYYTHYTLHTGPIPEGIVNLESLTEINLVDTYLSGKYIGYVLYKIILYVICRYTYMHLYYNNVDLTYYVLSEYHTTHIHVLYYYTLYNTYTGYDTKKGIFLMSSCGIWASDQYGKKGTY